MHTYLGCSSLSFILRFEKYALRGKCLLCIVKKYCVVTKRTTTGYIWKSTCSVVTIGMDLHIKTQCTGNFILSFYSFIFCLRVCAEWFLRTETNNKYLPHTYRKQPTSWKCLNFKKHSRHFDFGIFEWWCRCAPVFHCFLQ